MFHRKRPFVVNGIQNPTMKASIVGPYDKAININSNEDIEMISVFFLPCAAKLIMNIPCQEFKNSIIDLDSLEDQDFKDLKEMILEAESTELCIQKIEEFILKRLIRNHDSVYIKPFSKVFELLKTNPDASLNELANTACLSERQFRRVFIENVGMSPKQIQRQLRFYYAVKEFLTLGGVSIGYIVHKYGYTDYSHFYRDFREIVGMSPTGYLAFLANVCKPDVITTLRSYYAI